MLSTLNIAQLTCREPCLHRAWCRLPGATRSHLLLSSISYRSSDTRFPLGAAACRPSVTCPV